MGTLLLQTAAEPMRSWDGFSTWLARAAYFVVADRVELNLSPAAQYPPAYSMAHAVTYVFGGINDYAGMMMIVLIAGLFLATAADGMRSRRFSLIPWLFPALLIWLPLFRRNLADGYADAILGLSLSIGVAYATRKENGGTGSFYCAAIFLALTALLKIEGVVFAGIVMVLATIQWIIRIRIQPLKSTSPTAIRGLIGGWLIFVVPWLTWMILRGQAGVHGVQRDFFSLTHPMEVVDITRFFAIVRHLLWVGGFWPLFGALFLLFPCVLLLRAKRIEPFGLELPVVYFVCHIAVMVLIFMATRADFRWHMQTSADRLLLQAAPTVLCTIAMLLGRETETAV